MANTITINKQNPPILHTLNATLNGCPVRLLLDEGTSHSLINKKLAENLALPKISSCYLEIETMHGMESVVTEIVTYTLEASDKTPVKGLVSYKMEDLITLPLYDLSRDWNRIWPSLDNNLIAQLNMHMPNKEEIDIIIGMDNYWKLMLPNCKIHPSQNFGLKNTKLG